jgi:hypothetical protein
MNRKDSTENRFTLRAKVPLHALGVGSAKVAVNPKDNAVWLTQIQTTS